MALNPRYLAQKTGNGRHTIELYLDYVCPFSAKMFHVVASQVIPELNQTHPNTFEFVFRHQVQPWHPSSTLVHEAAIAVGLLNPDKFWEFSSALFLKSQEFYDESVWGESRPQTYQRLAELAYDAGGIDKLEFFKLLDIDRSSKNAGNKVTNDLKYFIKYARQNGVHVSPTVAIDGVIDPAFSSSWTCQQWIDKLRQIDEASKL